MGYYYAFFGVRRISWRFGNDGLPTISQLFGTAPALGRVYLFVLWLSGHRGEHCFLHAGLRLDEAVLASFEFDFLASIGAICVRDQQVVGLPYQDQWFRSIDLGICQIHDGTDRVIRTGYAVYVVDDRLSDLVRTNRESYHAGHCGDCELCAKQAADFYGN